MLRFPTSDQLQLEINVLSHYREEKKLLPEKSQNVSYAIKCVNFLGMARNGGVYVTFSTEHHSKTGTQTSNNEN